MALLGLSVRKYGAFCGKRVPMSEDTRNVRVRNPTGNSVSDPSRWHRQEF